MMQTANKNYHIDTPHKLSGATQKQASVLIVDDDIINQTILENMLSSYFNCILASNGRAALQICAEQKIDLILLDMHMPEMDGIAVCKTLKTCANNKDIPIIFVTGADDVKTQNACWEAGASDYLAKPVVLSTLVNRVRSHILNKFRIELLNALVCRDQLTGVLNRYYFNNELPKSLKQVVRDKKGVCAVLIDIDYFKRFNDTYGHLAGDKVLVSVAKALLSTLNRPSDSLIRFGGEEFFALLPDTDFNGGQTVSHRMLKTVREMAIPHNASPRSMVTISVGLFFIKPTQHTTLNALVSSADDALYEAKSQGRDRLMVRTG